MKQGRSSSSYTPIHNKNQFYINSNQKNKVEQNENNENINSLQYIYLQNGSNILQDSTRKYLQQSPFINSEGFNQSGLFSEKQFVDVLKNSCTHQRSKSNISVKNNDVLQNNQASSKQNENQKRNKKEKQLSEMEIKRINTMNFIQSMSETQRSNSNNSIILATLNSSNKISQNSGNLNHVNANQIQFNQVNFNQTNTINDSNLYTFSKLNEIRLQLKEQKDILDVKQSQRDFIKAQYDKESYKFDEKIVEIKQMIIEEEEINQKQQIIIKEQPEMRLLAIKKIFINSEKLFESLEKVNKLFEIECIKNNQMKNFEEFKKQQMPILGSLEKLFQEKLNLILKIYEKQDQLERYSEYRKMQQSDLEGYELRNIELALECDDLEAYIEMFKQNEDDCQILQQINLRNVWMCLQNELHKLKQRIEETEDIFNQLDNQSKGVEKQIESDVLEAKQFLTVKDNSFTTKEKVEELSLKEYIRTVLNDIGKEAYEEIEYLYDGEKIGQTVCIESYKQDYEQVPIFQNKMMNLIKAFQEVLIDEFQVYFNKYNEFIYKGEQDTSFMNIKKQLLSNVKIDYRNSKCGQTFEKMLDLNSLFSRIVINCKYKEEVSRVQRKIIDVLKIKKGSFQYQFDTSKIYCNLKHQTDLKSEELMSIQNEKFIVMTKLDQMKNRKKELVCEIEKQEQNTIPFFTTTNPTLNNDHANVKQITQNTKRSNCDDSYIFDDTTGHLNKTKITQTSNKVLINLLNDSHLNHTINQNNQNNPNQNNNSFNVLNYTNTNLNNNSFSNNNYQNNNFNNSGYKNSNYNNSGNNINNQNFNNYCNYNNSNQNTICKQNQSNSALNNSHVTICSYNNITKQCNTLTARSNQNNQSFMEKSTFHINNNNVSSCSLSPSNSTSKIQGIPPRQNTKNSAQKTQSQHYQAQYERKNQVDKIYIRMSEIKTQRDINNRFIREIIAEAEKDYPAIEQLERDTKIFTNDLLNLNGMQKEHAEKLVKVYHQFFDDNIENFIRKLEGYILIQQEIPLNEYTPALNFFFTRETLTPIGKLKLLDKKMEDLKNEEERQLSGFILKLQELDNDIIIITQRIYQIQLLYNKYDIPLGENNSQLTANAAPSLTCQSSSSSFAQGVVNDHSLNLSDIQATAHKMNSYNQIPSSHKMNSNNQVYSSSKCMKYGNNFLNETSLLQQQFGNSMFKNDYHQTSQKSSNSSQNYGVEKNMNVDQNMTRYMNSMSQKLRIHNILIDQSNKVNIVQAFLGEQGISLYKMFQVNQGNLVKSQIFDPLNQKKQPQLCGYGLRRLSINQDEVIFYQTKNHNIDLTIKFSDFTNIFIPPVTLEIIKYQTMNQNNKQLQKNSSKKFLEAQYYPFALEVKQTGRIECLCDNFESLKLIYTLFIAILTDYEEFADNN